MYSRRKNLKFDPKEIQKSKSIIGNDVSSENLTYFDMDIPIALRNGTRECTKYLFYPISSFISLEKCSPSHKRCLMSLNTVSISKTLSKTFTSKEWKNTMNIEMQIFENKISKWRFLLIEPSKSRRVTILLIYIDDIIVIGNDKEEKVALKQYLTRKFKIKELRKLKYLLRIEVAYSKSKTLISQQKYVTYL